MNKNLLLVGAVAVAGFTFSAFYGKTKAEQMAEIADKAKMGLETFRSEEKAKCDDRVAEAVAAKVAEMSAVPAPAETTVASKGVKKGTKAPSGPKAPTVPTPPPPPAKDPVKTRGGAVQQGTDDVKARGGAVKEGTQDVKKRGGAVKVEGGGGN